MNTLTNYMESDTRRPREKQLCPLCGAEFVRVIPICPQCGEDTKDRPRRGSILVLFTFVILAVTSSAFFGVLIGTIALTITVGSWFARTSRVPVTIYIFTAVIAWPTTAICKHLLLKTTYHIGYTTAIRDTESHRKAGTMDEFILALIRHKFGRKHSRLEKWEPVREFQYGYNSGWRSCFSQGINMGDLARKRITKDLNATILRDDQRVVIGVIVRRSDELQRTDLDLLAAFPRLKFLVLDGVTIGNEAITYIAPLKLHRLDLIGTNLTNYYELVGGLRAPRELRLADQELTMETRTKIERRYPTAKVTDFGMGEVAVLRCRKAIHGE